MKLQLKVEQPRIALNLNGKAEITFTTNKSVVESLENMKTEYLTLEIKEFREHRTLTQNDYLWVLLRELGNKMNIPTEKLYKQYIRDYGKFEIIPIKDEAVETFISHWNRVGLGNYAEVIRKSNIGGYSVLKIYFGSSTYNTKEMSHIIEPLLLDMEEQGIPIKTSKYDFMKLKNENDVETKKET